MLASPALYRRQKIAFEEWEAALAEAERVKVAKGTEAEATRAVAALDEAREHHQAIVDQVTRAEELEEARASLPVAPSLNEDEYEGSPSARVGVAYATPKRGWDPRTERVGGEPTTYRNQSGSASWFHDQLKAGKGDAEAIERILRSSRELADAGRPIAMKTSMTRGREVLSERAIAETAGAGGELVAPLYLQEEYLKLARAARPYADLMRKVPLPPNTNVINIPRLKTGTKTAAQLDLGTVEDVNLATGLLTFHVITVAGQEDFARQLFDRSVPELADMVVFPDLIADYLTKSDVQMISGNGTLPNSLGALEVSERNKVTFTSASPTLPELYKKIANAVQLIHTLRFLPPDAIIMHPRRWAWVITQVDTQNRPLVVPASQGPMNVFGNLNEVASEGLVGSMQGLPVYVDPSLPTNLGASTEQDPIIVQRMADSWFMEDDPIKTRVYEEVLSNELAIRAQCFNYLAGTHERYAKAIATIEGSGLNSPVF
jgi:HK97 family phage major capsid protein